MLELPAFPSEAVRVLHAIQHDDANGGKDEKAVSFAGSSAYSPSSYSYRPNCSERSCPKPCTQP